MPSVKDNNKYRCKNDGSIYSFDSPAQVRPCGSCGEVNYDQIRITLVCDFCGIPEDSPWTVPCKDFTVFTDNPNLPAERKVGDWAACEECKDLFVAGDIQGLANFATERGIAREPGLAVIRSLLQEELFKLHSTVASLSEGEPWFGRSE